MRIGELLTFMVNQQIQVGGCQVRVVGFSNLLGLIISFIHGAVMVDNSKDKKTKTKSSKSVKVETTSDFLEGMTIKYFGKGLILTCKTNHPSYRFLIYLEKHLMVDGGKNLDKGWFFKNLSFRLSC